MTTLFGLRPQALFTSGLVPSNKLADGDMEDPSTASWAAGNSAALSKAAAIDDGEYSLKVAYGGASYPRAYQTVLTIGKRYKMTGAALRTNSPLRILNGATVLWSAAISVNPQYVVENFVATSADIIFENLSTSTTSEGFWDNFVIQEVDVLGYPIGQKYCLSGYARGDGTYYPMIYNSSGGGANYQLWYGTTSTDWQRFDIYFWPKTANLILTSNDIFGVCGWDNLVLRKAENEQIITDAGISNFDPHILEYHVDPGVSEEFFADNVLKATSGLITKRLLDGAGRVAADIDGGGSDAIHQFWEGYIGELLVYEAYLTAGERLQVYNYLKSKWGI